MITDEVARNIDAYDAMAHRLEQDNIGKWTVFQHGKLLGIYATSADARRASVPHHNKHPHHPPYIRQVGPMPIMIPSIFAVLGRNYADD